MDAACRVLITCWCALQDDQATDGQYVRRSVARLCKAVPLSCLRENT